MTSKPFFKITFIMRNKNQKNLKIMYQNSVFSVSPDITKINNFRWKNADVSRTQGLCQVIYTFFGSSLGKV